MPATITRRLERLEAVHRLAIQERHDAAIRAMGASMAPEHIKLIQDWMREHCGGLSLPRLPGESWYALLERLRPPAFVRAVWLMHFEHLTSGAPVAMPPNVAEVYLNDAQAVPSNPCEGCGYLMPAQSTIRPDDTYRHRGWYMGVCPVCGLDNHPQEAEDA